MLIPVRCFNCGGLMADKYEEYSNRIKAGEESGNALDSIGIKRYCCSRMFISSVETIYQVIPYYEVLRQRKNEMESEINQ